MKGSFGSEVRVILKVTFAAVGAAIVCKAKIAKVWLKLDKT